MNGLLKVEKSCPHEDQTQRNKMSGLIKEIEAIHGRGPYNMFKSMDKIFGEYLPHNQD
jgi:hypothetical protein